MPKGDPNKPPKRYRPHQIDAMVDTLMNHRINVWKKGHIKDDGVYAPPSPAADEQMPEPPPTHDGYCVKCKKRSTADTEKVEKTKTGSHHVSGKCQTCGTPVHTFKSDIDGTALAEQLVASTQRGTRR